MESGQSQNSCDYGFHQAAGGLRHAKKDLIFDKWCFPHRWSFDVIPWVYNTALQDNLISVCRPGYLILRFLSQYRYQFLIEKQLTKPGTSHNSFAIFFCSSMSRSYVDCAGPSFSRLLKAFDKISCRRWKSNISLFVPGFIGQSGYCSECRLRIALTYGRSQTLGALSQLSAYSIDFVRLNRIWCQSYVERK